MLFSSQPFSLINLASKVSEPSHPTPLSCPPIPLIDITELVENSTAAMVQIVFPLPEIDVEILRFSPIFAAATVKLGVVVDITGFSAPL